MAAQKPGQRELAGLRTMLEVTAPSDRTNAAYAQAIADAFELVAMCAYVRIDTHCAALIRPPVA